MSPNDADWMAKSVDPAVWSGSALFAQAYLSENLGSLRYIFCFANTNKLKEDILIQQLSIKKWLMLVEKYPWW